MRQRIICFVLLTLAANLSAQVTTIFELPANAEVLLSQATPPSPPATPPSPPATPPSPPAAPPSPPLQDLVRLMATRGSYLGVGVRDVDSERKQALNLKEERGAEITSVEKDSPAAKAGLQAGDVVLDYAGNRVESMEQFIRLVRETPAGREVKIVVSRNGSPLTLTAKLDSNQARLERNLQVARDMKVLAEGMDMPRAAMYWKSFQLGIEAEALEGQLAEFFGVKQGVLVRSVGANTPAEKAQLKAGDVILAVEGAKVTSPREITNALRSARQNSQVITLTLSRDRKEQQLKVEFAESISLPRRVTPRARMVQNDFQ
jgi:serine protease Do